MQQRRAPSLGAALSLLRRRAGTGREEKQAGGHEEPEQSHRGAPADIVHPAVDFRKGCLKLTPDTHGHPVDQRRVGRPDALCKHDMPSASLPMACAAGSPGRRLMSATTSAYAGFTQLHGLLDLHHSS